MAKKAKKTYSWIDGEGSKNSQSKNSDSKNLDLTSQSKNSEDKIPINNLEVSVNDQDHPYDVKSSDKSKLTPNNFQDPNNETNLQIIDDNKKLQSKNLDLTSQSKNLDLTSQSKNLDLSSQSKNSDSKNSKKISELESKISNLVSMVAKQQELIIDLGVKEHYTVNDLLEGIIDVASECKNPRKKVKYRKMADLIRESTKDVDWKEKKNATFQIQRVALALEMLLEKFRMVPR